MIMLIVLERPRDIHTLARQVMWAGLTFGTAIVGCFALKLLVVWMVWGTGEIADFFSILALRIGGAVSQQIPPALADWLQARGIDVGLFDRSFPARVLLGGIMLSYSAFFIGWGSHILGGALVLLPLPYLLYRAGCVMRAGTAWPMRIEVHFLAIGLMPILWYLMFTNHTALHSSYMVRPLTLNVALAAIVLTLVPVEVRRKPAETVRA